MFTCGGPGHFLGAQCELMVALQMFGEASSLTSKASEADLMILFSDLNRCLMVAGALLIGRRILQCGLCV